MLYRSVAPQIANETSRIPLELKRKPTFSCINGIVDPANLRNQHVVMGIARALAASVQPLWNVLQERFFVRDCANTLPASYSPQIQESISK